jgi:hypothetical protein
VTLFLFYVLVLFQYCRRFQPVDFSGVFSMRDVQAEAAYLQLVFHDDDETPYDFMIDLARSVFSLPAAVATALSATVERRGKAVLRNLSARGRRGAASDGATAHRGSRTFNGDHDQGRRRYWPP